MLTLRWRRLPAACPLLLVTCCRRAGGRPLCYCWTLRRAFGRPAVAAGAIRHPAAGLGHSLLPSGRRRGLPAPLLLIPRSDPVQLVRPTLPWRLPTPRVAPAHFGWPLRSRAVALDARAAVTKAPASAARAGCNDGNAAPIRTAMIDCVGHGTFPWLVVLFASRGIADAPCYGSGIEGENYGTNRSANYVLYNRQR